MIIGEFDEWGRLIIARLNVNRRIPFLLDTGAERTCLHPRDTNRARIPIEALGGAIQSRGVGGLSRYYRESALLSFYDQLYTRVYAIELLIADPHEGNEGLPSLLGRDVLNSWNINYDPMTDTLECNVRHADHTLAVS